MNPTRNSVRQLKLTRRTHYFDRLNIISSVVMCSINVFRSSKSSLTTRIVMCSTS